LKSKEKKSSQTAASKPNPKQERRRIRKEAKGSQFSWRQGNIKCAVSEEYASCWVYEDCHVADEQKAALKKAAGVSGGNDEY